MRTVLDSRHAAIGLAVEHDGLAHDGAGDELAVDEAIGPCGHIPGIANIGPADEFLPQLERGCPDSDWRDCIVVCPLLAAPRGTLAGGLVERI